MKKILIVDDEISYHFLPSLSFENKIVESINSDSDVLVKHIEESLQEKVMNRYKTNKKSDEYYLLKYKNDLLTYITSSYTLEELASLYDVSKTNSDVGKIKANKFIERIKAACPKQIFIEGK